MIKREFTKRLNFIDIKYLEYNVDKTCKCKSLKSVEYKSFICTNVQYLEALDSNDPDIVNITLDILENIEGIEITKEYTLIL